MKIGVLGCGNMASAVVEGMSASDTQFITYTPSQTRAISLADKVGGRHVSSLEELGETDMVIIGCKPHQFSTLAGELLEKRVPLKMVVSIMAAISIGDIQGGAERGGCDPLDALFAHAAWRRYQFALLCCRCEAGNPPLFSPHFGKVFKSFRAAIGGLVGQADFGGGLWPGLYLLFNPGF